MNQPSVKRRRFRWGLLVFIAGCGVILAVLLFWQPISAPISTERWSYINLRSVHRALENFAENHEGRLPPLLEALEPNPLTPGGLDALRFRDVESKRRYDWIYFPAPKLTPLPADYILIASPTTFSRQGKRRIVLHPNGSLTYIEETEYQRRIRRQILSADRESGSPLTPSTPSAGDIEE